MPTDEGKQTASTTASRLPAERFSYRGQSWTIRKRSIEPGANWYFYFERNKKRFGPWSLGTTALKQAVAEAKLRIDLHAAGREADLRRAMIRPDQRQFATFADIFARVHDLAIHARTRKCRDSYIWGTRFVFSRILSLPDPKLVDAQSAVAVSGPNAELFFARAMAEANKLDSQAAQNTFMRTCNQAFNFCAALFAPKAVRSMRRDFKLSIPETVEAFRACSKTDRLDASDASEFQRPADAVLRRTLIEWVRLGRTPGYAIPGGRHHSGKPDQIAPLSELARRNMFIAVALELMFGLRKGELPKVKWSWFDHIEGVPMLRCQTVSVKGRTNELNIVALDPFWRIFNRVLERNRWRGEPADFCLSERSKTAGRSAHSPGLVFSHGGPTDRTYWPAIDVGHWLRWLGWTSQKTNHALRDYGASLITMRFGLDAASRWCRHRNRATTESHYSRFVELGKIASPARLRWIRWGK